MPALLKPSRLARKGDKFDKRIEAKGAKIRRERAEAAIWKAIAEPIWTRDEHRCRVCSLTVRRVGIGDPRTWGHVHHIIYRSAGGGDYPLNLVLLCGRCHDDEHRHLISITGTAKKLKVQSYKARSAVQG